MTGAIPTEPVDVDDTTLAEAEAAIGDAIERRDASDLAVLGFGEAEHRRLVKVLPFLARCSMAERWWSTKVRRRPYDFFITDSFSGELL
ncbi:MAG: hypothetical protein ACR2QO_15695 [Acidimicrobiales bacterium]